MCQRQQRVAPDSIALNTRDTFHMKDCKPVKTQQNSMPLLLTQPICQLEPSLSWNILPLAFCIFLTRRITEQRNWLKLQTFLVANDKKKLKIAKVPQKIPSLWREQLPLYSDELLPRWGALVLPTRICEPHVESSRWKTKMSFSAGCQPSHEWETVQFWRQQLPWSGAQTTSILKFKQINLKKREKSRLNKLPVSKTHRHDLQEKYWNLWKKA